MVLLCGCSLIASDRLWGSVDPADPSWHEFEGQALSVRKLPHQVPQPAGVVSIHADYAHQSRFSDREDCVPLYVVNRSSQPLSLSLQDWYSYFQAEVLIAGEWVRTNPFGFSWCGNSYHGVTIDPNQFVIFRGFLPKPGDKQAPLRFRRTLNVDRELISNQGAASYRPLDVETARYDALAMQDSPDAQILMEIVEGRKGFRDKYIFVEPQTAAEVLGTDHTQEALRWVEAHPDPDEEQIVVLNAMLTGLIEAPSTTFDQAWGYYLHQRKIGIHPGDFNLGKRFPWQVLRYRDALPATQPEQQHVWIRRLEIAALRNSPLDLVEAVLAGEMTISAGEARAMDMAVYRLVHAFPDDAERIASRYELLGGESRELAEAIRKAMAEQQRASSNISN